MAKKIKIHKCNICKHQIKDDESCGIFHRKTLYPDYDGVWFTVNKVFICEKCLKKLQEQVKESE